MNLINPILVFISESVFTEWIKYGIYLSLGAISKTLDKKTEELLLIDFQEIGAKNE